MMLKGKDKPKQDSHIYSQEATWSTTATTLLTHSGQCCIYIYIYILPYRSVDGTLYIYYLRVLHTCQRNAASPGTAVVDHRSLDSFL